jgi:hypothetical protein
MLARGKGMAELHSNHDQAWVSALENILSGQSFDDELAWFHEHRHVSTGKLLERIRSLLPN